MLRQMFNRKSTVLGAKYNGKIAGYVWIQRHWWYFTEAGRVGSIAILPEYRRQGIATRLMSHAEKIMQSRNVKLMLLEVSIENKAAYKLYQKLDYQALEKLKRYDGYSDYSWMCKWIDSR